MKISTKGRYALRLMLDLAVNAKDERVSVKSIAARQEISDKYLEQIITSLSPRRLCGKRTGRTGRISSVPPSRGVYGRHDPSADRGQPRPGCLYGG